MPSKSYYGFRKNAKQVDRLLDAYCNALSPTRGRKHLDHFTRSALLFLCAAWEVYIEQVAIECVKIISAKISSPIDLPKEVKKNLSSAVKSDKHDLSPMQFAHNWKEYYSKQVLIYIDGLNTPKKKHVLDIFQHYLGIPQNTMLAQVPTLNKVDDIVKTRGDIAHNVFVEEYLRKETVDSYYATISRAVTEIEILLWNYLPANHKW